MEGQEALAGAPVRRAHRQPAKVLRRLAPAGMINRQHDGTAYLPAAGCNAPVYPNPHQKPWASNWTRFSNSCCALHTPVRDDKYGMKLACYDMLHERTQRPLGAGP